MASSKITCRLCLTETQAKYSFGIFTVEGRKQGWARRISVLLQVPVSSDDDLPTSFCRCCRNKLLSLEDKLQRLRTTAQESYQRLQERELMARKRKKATSGVGVSPCTASLRPPSKRAYLQPRSLFENTETSSEGE